MRNATKQWEALSPRQQQRAFTLLRKKGVTAIPEQWVLSMICEGDTLARNLFASDTATPTIDLMFLLNTYRKETGTVVLANPSLPESVIREAARSGQPFFRVGVARNPSLPADLNEEFAQDTDRELLLALINNPSTPIATITMVATKVILLHNLAVNVLTNRKTEWRTYLSTAHPHLPERLNIREALHAIRQEHERNLDNQPERNAL